MNINPLYIFVGVFSTPNVPVYSATKSGIVGFTMSLRERSSSDGVRVNCICPDTTDTKLISDYISRSYETPEKVQEDARRIMIR